MTGDGTKLLFGVVGVGGTLTWAGGVIDLQADGTALQTSNLGTLANAGTVRKSGGAGTTTIDWAVTNSGTIDVQSGTLTFVAPVANAGVVTTANGRQINANITTAAGGSVQSAAGGSSTYVGTQTFDSGTLAPGGSAAGSIVIQGALVLSANAAIDIGVNGTVPITGYDRLTVNGTVSLGDAVLTGNTIGLSVTVADRFAILENDGTDAVTGTFAGLPQNGFGQLDGYFFSITYEGDASTLALTGGNDIVIYNLVPVPEPATVLAVAAVGLLIGRRVKQKKWQATPNI